MSNRELWKATDQESAEVLLKQKEMDMDRTHVEETKRQHRKKSSPVEPQGQRNRGRPKNTWKRGVEQEKKEAGVTWGSLEASAQDRMKWKQFVGGLCSTSGATKA